jgi:hypothetical protein
MPLILAPPVMPSTVAASGTVMMYCHTLGQVTCWLVKNGFGLAGSVEFTIWIDEQHTKKFPARAYLAEKSSPIHQELR